MAETTESELKRTALFEQHKMLNGRMVPFGGWEMPIHYGSQVDEHHAVRQKVGMFDVSHMTIVDLEGDDAEAFVSILIANDVAKLKANGEALYTAMLNDHAGIIDDLIVYKMAFGYRLVVNCATRETDLDWFAEVKQREGFESLTLTEQQGLSIIAVQGPDAIDTVSRQLGGEVGGMLQRIARFTGMAFNRWFIARTGYTGEEGVEIMLPSEDAVVLWQQLSSAGVTPCGLGARDTLRLEAGMNLYGSDMDPSVTPLESNIAWTVAWTEGRPFIGRSVLEVQKAQGAERTLVGLKMAGRGIIRSGYKVMQDGAHVGVVTSGGFSPTLGVSIALARIEANLDPEKPLSVEIRGKLQPVHREKPPFYKRG